MFRIGTYTLAVSLLAVSLVAGCAVGPDFRRPAAPADGDYTARPLASTAATPNVAGGEAQRFAAGRDIAGDWWTLFHSKPLDELIELSLKNNPDLKAAQAALSAARENVLAQRGAYYPAVAAGFSASRQNQSALLAPVPNYPVVANEFQYDLFTPQVSVSYVPDVFGLNRRTVESLKAQEQGVRFQMIATYNTLDRQRGGRGDSGGRVADADRRDAPAHRPQLPHGSDPAIPVRQGLCQPARSGRAGIATRASPARRCRRCSSNRPSCATCWPFWPGGFRTRRRRTNSSFRVCNCRRNCR